METAKPEKQKSPETTLGRSDSPARAQKRRKTTPSTPKVEPDLLPTPRHALSPRRSEFLYPHLPFADYSFGHLDEHAKYSSDLPTEPSPLPNSALFSAEQRKMLNFLRDQPELLVPFAPWFGRDGRPVTEGDSVLESDLICQLMANNSFTGIDSKIGGMADPLELLSYAQACAQKVCFLTSSFRSSSFTPGPNLTPFLLQSVTAWALAARKLRATA